MKSLRESLGLTQQQVADATGMSRLAVLRYEQYLYDHLSDKLAEFYGKQIEQSPEFVHQLYQDERLVQRNYANSIILEPFPTLRITHEHPFTTFRRTLTWRAVGKDSRMAFCKLLALHPATVAEYEAAKLRTMPKVIRDSLFSLPDWYLDNLNDLGEIWYERRSRSGN